MQTTVWTVLDAVFFFWAIVAPFSYQQFKISGRVRMVHIISVLLGLLVPLPTPLIEIVYGYTYYYSPLIICIGYGRDFLHYTWLFPISMQKGFQWTLCKIPK